MKTTAIVVHWVLPLAIVVLAAVSALAYLQLDTIVNETLYLYGLQFSEDWYVPYLTTIRTMLALMGVIAAVAIAILAAAFFLKPSKKSEAPEENGVAKDKHWNTYKLSDGSTIKIKTVLKGVKRLNTFSADGKPMYSVKADNLVEVVDAPRQLMKSNQEDQT